MAKIGRNFKKILGVNCFNPNQAVMGRIPPQAHLTACHFELREVMSVKKQCNFLFWSLKQTGIKNLGVLYKFFENFGFRKKKIMRKS